MLFFKCSGDSSLNFKITQAMITINDDVGVQHQAERGLTPEEGVQAYGGSYSSVTYSGIIRTEIVVMRFPCDEVAMSDGFEKQNLAPTVPKTVHANDLSLEICIPRVVKSLHSSRDCWTCSRLCVRML